MRISLIILVALLVLLSVNRVSTQERETQHYAALNLRGDTAFVAASSDTLRTMIMFMSGYACKDCFTIVDSAAQLAMKEGAIDRFVVVVRTEGGVYQRRIWIKNAQHLSPSADEIFFDVIPDDVDDPWPPIDLQGGIFGALNVSKTPGIFLVGRNFEKFFSYENLFGHLTDASVAEQISDIHLRLTANR